MLKKSLSFCTLIFVFLCNLQAQNSSNIAASHSIYSAGSSNDYHRTGKFITITAMTGFESSVYAAGPEDATAGILIVHDFFGITPAVIESADRLGALGYRTIVVDLYRGKIAGSQDSAQAYMREKVRTETDLILQGAIKCLKRPGRKLATIGFSAGGIDAVYANVMDPESFFATVLIYAGDYDMIGESKIEKLKSPILAISGSLDTWAVQAALNFFVHEKDKSFELYIYPGADHGYAQPLFLNGKNYDAEATRMTWKLTEDFLNRHLNK
jgi:carboxymethylenebutenolidase